MADISQDNLEEKEQMIPIEDGTQVFGPLFGPGSDKDRNLLERKVQVTRQELRAKEQKEKMRKFTEALRRK